MASQLYQSDNKRSLWDLYSEEDDDNFWSRKKLKETAPGVATGMILSLRESLKNCQDELSTRRSSEDSLIEQLNKAKEKEAAFIMTFAKREQEIAELRSCFRDLRAQLKPQSLKVRRLLLDPAIHEEFIRLKNLVEEKDKKIKELEDNIAAVSFTPQSKTGKMLMAKCRTLQEENEEFGNQDKEGKVHELTMKLSLQKSQNAELKSRCEGICKHTEKLMGDVDRSNELVVFLREKLEEKDDEIRRLKQEVQGSSNGNGVEKS